MLIFMCLTIAIVMAFLIGGRAPPQAFAHRVALILGTFCSTIAIGVCVTIVEVIIGVHKVDLIDVMPWTLGILFLCYARFFFGGGRLKALWTKK